MKNCTPYQGTNEKDLFLQAFDIQNPREQALFLAQVCGQDERLRRRLENLLQIGATGDDFLDPDRFEVLKRERELLLRDLAEEVRVLNELGASKRSLGKDYEWRE